MNLIGKYLFTIMSLVLVGTNALCQSPVRLSPLESSTYRSFHYTVLAGGEISDCNTPTLNSDYFNTIYSHDMKGRGFGPIISAEITLVPLNPRIPDISFGVTTGYNLNIFSLGESVMYPSYYYVMPYISVGRILAGYVGYSNLIRCGFQSNMSGMSYRFFSEDCFSRYVGGLTAGLMVTLAGIRLTTGLSFYLNSPRINVDAMEYYSMHHYSVDDDKLIVDFTVKLEFVIFGNSKK